MIYWITTEKAPGLTTESFDPGKRHAVEILGENPRYIDAKRTKAACGLKPRRSWGDDMFLHDDERCQKCERALGLDPSPVNARRQKYAKEIREKRKALTSANSRA